jgi:hypothetical protein
MNDRGRSGAPGEAQRLQQRRVEELERRIAELEGLDESAFGRFTAWDWGVCVVGALVLPVLALWWFAG